MVKTSKSGTGLRGKPDSSGSGVAARSASPETFEDHGWKGIESVSLRGLLVYIQREIIAACEEQIEIRIESELYRHLTVTKGDDSSGTTSVYIHMRGKTDLATNPVCSSF